MKPWFPPALPAAVAALVFAPIAALTHYWCGPPMNWAAVGLEASTVFVIFCVVAELLIYKRLRVLYRKLLKVIQRRTQARPDVSSDVIEGLSTAIVELSGVISREFRELRELEIFRKEYIAVVSHELKTPIFVIEGYLETLLDGALEDENVNRKFLTQSLRHVHRLNNLVKDLIIISQLESGQVEMQRESFRIYDLVLDVFASLDYLAPLQEKRIRLMVEAHNNEKVYVLADQERIRQVLLNLISNGIYYGNPDGFVKVSLQNQPDKILISIEDNGPGIAPEHLPHIFERFYRVETSRSRANGGTGLGLSIVKYLLEAHQEQIFVESTPGVGATFSFTLTKDQQHPR